MAILGAAFIDAFFLKIKGTTSLKKIYNLKIIQVANPNLKSLPWKIGLARYILDLFLKIFTLGGPTAIALFRKDRRHLTDLNVGTQVVQTAERLISEDNKILRFIKMIMGCIWITLSTAFICLFFYLNPLSIELTPQGIYCIYNYAHDSENSQETNPDQTP